MVMNGEMIVEQGVEIERKARAHKYPRRKNSARPHLYVWYRVPLGACIIGILNLA
jgi:hypothetical protein